MDEVSIGRTVRWARRRAGLSQQELAKATGMPQPSIARIERGAVSPRATSLIALLRATGHELAVQPLRTGTDTAAIEQTLALQVPARTRRALGQAAAKSRTGPIGILRRLRRFGVPLVLIGELAEIAHGRPGKAGRVVEVVHPGTDVARERIGLAVADLRSDKADLSRLRLLEETDLGDTYELLLRTAVRMPVDSGLLIPVASLEDLIRHRSARGTVEDRAVADLLAAVVAATEDRERWLAGGGRRS